MALKGLVAEYVARRERDRRAEPAGRCVEAAVAFAKTAASARARAYKKPAVGHKPAVCGRAIVGFGQEGGVGVGLARLGLPLSPYGQTQASGLANAAMRQMELAGQYQLAAYFCVIRATA